MMPQTNQKDFEKPQASPIKSGLYIVATPIGNLRDITFRALDILSAVDLVVCEDTRVTGKLLQAYRLKKEMMSYNDHNAARQRGTIIDALAAGKSVALVSDAGTPLVSDPGYKLVQEVLEQDFMVTSIPGANAALVALQLSGLPSDGFSFLGFLPPKTVGRQKALEKWKETPGSMICYETAPRLLASLKDMKAVLGNREAAVTRELTKMYEEVRRGQLSKLISYYTKNGPPKGEVVVVLGHAEDKPLSMESIEEQIKKALKKMSVRDAAEFVAQATGKPKKTIYTLALKLSSGA